MIVELVQAQPSSFATGYCSGRIWINGVATPSSRTYFCNFASGIYLFNDMNDVEINLCARRNSGTTSLVQFGYYDAMNFIWFRGAEGLYVPSGGKLL